MMKSRFNSLAFKTTLSVMAVAASLVVLVKPAVSAVSYLVQTPGFYQLMSLVTTAVLVGVAATLSPVVFGFCSAAADMKFVARMLLPSVGVGFSAAVVAVGIGWIVATAPALDAYRVAPLAIGLVLNVAVVMHCVKVGCKVVSRYRRMLEWNREFNGW